MAEHWDMFFKTARPKESESGGITLATTTDTQRQVNDAAADRSRREREATYVYTQVGPGIVEQDGSIEHSEPIVKTDGPKPDDPGERLENMDVPLSPQQLAQQNVGYQIQLLAARAAIPDFDEVIGQAELIPDTALRIIRGLPNGALVGYYLGKHRTECARLRGMTAKQAQQRVTEISAALVTNPAGTALDVAPYPVYRRLRNEQIRSRR
jgi:hypothetical protein